MANLQITFQQSGEMSVLRVDKMDGSEPTVYTSVDTNEADILGEALQDVADTAHRFALCRAALNARHDLLKSRQEGFFTALSQLRRWGVTL